MLRLALAAGLFASAAFAHSYTAGALQIAHPWTRAAQAGGNGAGYLSVANPGTADRLLGATSPAAARVELHRVEDDNGVMRMREVTDGLAVPPNGELKLAPGGLHIMLLGLKQNLAPGQMIPLSLRFERAGAVEVELKVEDGASAETHRHHNH